MGLLAKIFESAQSHGRPQRALVSWPPTCEFAMMLYLLFGTCCAAFILWYDTTHNTQILSALYSRDVELKLAKFGFMTTAIPVLILAATFTLAPQSKVAKYLSVVARLSDPRFPEMNPPVFDLSAKQNND